MRTISLATLFAASFALILSFTGCGKSDPEVTPSADSDTTLGEAQDAEGSEGVEGNSEPPLPDVTSAVESVPEAETGDPEVAVDAASPEEFQQVALERVGLTSTSKTSGNSCSAALMLRLTWATACTKTSTNWNHKGFCQRRKPTSPSVLENVASARWARWEAGTISWSYRPSARWLTKPPPRPGDSTRTRWWR